MIVKSQEICDALGIDKANARMWKKRKHITISEGGTVDLSKKKNYNYIRGMFEKKDIPYPFNEVEKTEPAETLEESYTTSLPQLKLKTEIAINKIKIKKEKLDLSKKEGKVIEVSAAKEITRRVVVELCSGNREDFKRMVMEICDENGIDYNLASNYQHQIDSSVNERFNSVKDILIAEIEKSVDDFMGTRNRGERIG